MTFHENADRWAPREMRSGQERHVFDAIVGLLDSHDLPYCFDVTFDESECFLIFSPEGDPDDCIPESRYARSPRAPRSRTWEGLGTQAQKAPA